MKILIDTDWFGAIRDLRPSKQKEVLLAILNYPNGHSDTHLWKETILPTLEKGEISYFNKLQNLKQNKKTICDFPQKSSKKNTDTDTDSDTDSIVDSIVDSDTDSTSNIDKIYKKEIGGVGGKEKENNLWGYFQQFVAWWNRELVTRRENTENNVEIIAMATMERYKVFCDRWADTANSMGGNPTPSEIYKHLTERVVGESYLASDYLRGCTEHKIIFKFDKIFQPKIWAGLLEHRYINDEYK